MGPDWFGMKLYHIHLMKTSNTSRLESVIVDNRQAFGQEKYAVGTV